MAANIKVVSKDDEKHLLTTEETLDLPSFMIEHAFLERRSMKVNMYWCEDDTGAFYILR
jgi:hypothetical protein